jgi:hypothetical protein
MRCKQIPIKSVVQPLPTIDKERESVVTTSANSSQMITMLQNIISRLDLCIENFSVIQDSLIDKNQIIKELDIIKNIIASPIFNNLVSEKQIDFVKETLELSTGKGLTPLQVVLEDLVEALINNAFGLQEVGYENILGNSDDHFSGALDLIG